MTLSTARLNRCIQTLELSLRFYEKTAVESVEQEVFRNAIVRGCELTQETSFKLLRRALKAYGHGSRKLDATPVKDLLRLAATHGLMTIEEVERWFAYQDNRNDTAHDYGLGFAQETLVLIPGFLDDARRLESALRAHFEKAE